MKRWKFFIWGMIFLCLIVVWISRASYMDYRLAVERGERKYELQLKTEERQKRLPEEEMQKRLPQKKLPEESLKPELDSLDPQKSFDVWDWILKICGGLAGLKTLVELVDKFRRKKT